MNYNIAYSFSENARISPDSTALALGKSQLSYGELLRSVRTLGSRLHCTLNSGNSESSGRVGILATRSIEACAGILATAWAGGTYVPLGQKLPESRLLQLFELLDLDALVVDEAGRKLLSDDILAAAPIAIYAPGPTPGSFVDARNGEAIDAQVLLSAPVSTDADHLAYVEFTSGTTGMPKGVMVSNGAVRSYIDAMKRWYDFGPDDRAAETCDITFDLSVHNMLMAWDAGAALHLMRPLDMLTPARFLARNGITTWLSVPSVVAMARETGALQPGSMPSLRISLFCGEALPADVANAWMAAAPNSVVDNIYGPTEATIACLRQTWSENGLVTGERGIVAIGEPYDGMEAMILDSDLNPVADGQAGEIALSGRQLADGYFRQPDLTAERFPVIGGKRWYLTGDSGYCDEGGIFHHLGRLDNQIKLKGYRIELEEIDMKLREAARVDLAATIAWPVRDGVAQGIVGFCTGASTDANDILSRLREALPAYMVPSRVEIIDAMPLNANGKIDRKALAARLENQPGRREVA